MLDVINGELQQRGQGVNKLGRTNSSMILLAEACGSSQSVTCPTLLMLNLLNKEHQSPDAVKKLRRSTPVLPSTHPLLIAVRCDSFWKCWIMKVYPVRDKALALALPSQPHCTHVHVGGQVSCYISWSCSRAAGKLPSAGGSWR